MNPSHHDAALAACFPSAAQLPPEQLPPGPLHQRELLLAGALQPWHGATQTVHSPVHLRNADGGLTPVELGSVPRCGVAEADAALDAACAAYAQGRGLWPTLSTAERIARVEDFTRHLMARREDIVRLIMWEIGKRRGDSEREFDRTIDYIAATIEELKRVDNESSRFRIVEGTVAQIRRSPLGVVLCLGPYNYPMNETFTTLIPALIMGNVVLFKPPRFGVLLYQPMLAAFQAAFPPGVINIVYGHGHEVVPHIMASGKIDVLALIGSSRVADQLKKAHPRSNRLRAVLGLEAKNAAIVLPDADLELAVRECVAGALSFNGQRCTAIKMILVHDDIAADFVARLGQAVAALQPGMPWQAQADITPLPDAGRVAYLHECLDDALAQGAQVINPGGGHSLASLFMPAVVYPVRPGMKLYREEQFGPLVPVARFAHIDEALDYVVSSDHGQQASLFGRDPERVAELVDALVSQVCRVNINCQCQRSPDAFPFAGRKDSAEGTLSVHDALRAFSIRTMVAARYTEASRRLLDDIVLGHKSSFINTRFIL